MSYPQVRQDARAAPVGVSFRILDGRQLSASLVVEPVGTIHARHSITHLGPLFRRILITTTVVTTVQR